MTAVAGTGGSAASRGGSEGGLDSRGGAGGGLVSSGGSASAGGLAPIAGGGGAGGGVSAGAGSAGAAGSGSAGAGAGSAGSGSVPTEVSWKVIAESQNSKVYVNVPVAASRGSDAAVAYVEQTVTAELTTTRVVMQRFDENGERLGELVLLGSDSDAYSNVTLASDGKQYAACWTALAEVHCSRVDEEGHVHVDELELAGQSPTIVASANGWAVAYTGSDKYVRLQALTSSLALSGSRVDLKVFAQSGARELGPVFARTPAGYVLVASNSEAGEVGLLRLGADLGPVGTTIPLGRSLWFASQVAASDSRVALSISAPYGSYLLLLNQNELTAELPIAGGGKQGTAQALMLMTGGFGAAWLDPRGGVRRRFFADGEDSAIGLANRMAGRGPLGLEEEASDTYQQLLRVGARTLLVARATHYGLLQGTLAIRVATLTFP